MYRQLKGLICLAILFMSQSLVFAQSDSAIENDTKTILIKMLNINVESVKIADGRAKGGERLMIVTYRQNDISGKGNIGEIVQVLEAGYAANKNMNADLDSVAAVIGDRNGTALGIVRIKVSDAYWFMKTKNAQGYLNRWSVKKMSPRFLPVVSKRMGW